jgi:hypothetical protein
VSSARNGTEASAIGFLKNACRSEDQAMDKAPATNPTSSQDIHRDTGFREGPPAKEPGVKAPATVQPPGSGVGQGVAKDAPAGEEMSGEASPGLTISGGGGHA